MIQINLIPDVKKEHLKAVKQKKIITSSAFIVSGAFLAIIVLLIVTVFVVQKKHISDLTTDINEDVASLQAVADLDKVLTIQNQLNALPELYATKPNGSNLFQYLSVITPPDIKLTSVQISYDASAGAGVMSISGETATIKDVNRFVDIIKNATYTAKDTGTGEEVTGKAFSVVVLESISKSTNEGSKTSFTISAQYSADIFNIKYDSVKLTVPSITSSVSSTEKPNFNTQPFDEGTQE